MDVYDVIESILDANGGEVKGRTAIQKLVYFAGLKIPELDIPQYKPDYFGPYSAKVAQSLAMLVAYLFVLERPLVGWSYAYSLTSDGRQITDQIKAENRDEYDKIKKVVKTCRDVCGLKTESLSNASKIHYWTGTEIHESRRVSVTDAIAMAKQLAWNVSPDDVDQGAELLKALKVGPYSANPEVLKANQK